MIQKKIRKIAIILILIAIIILSFFAGKAFQQKETSMESFLEFQNYIFNNLWNVSDRLDHAVENQDRDELRVAALDILELEVMQRDYYGSSIWPDLSNVLLWGGTLNNISIQPCYSENQLTSEELDSIKKLSLLLDSFVVKLSAESDDISVREIAYLSEYSFQLEWSTFEQEIQKLLT